MKKPSEPHKPWFQWNGRQWQPVTPQGWTASIFIAISMLAVATLPLTMPQQYFGAALATAILGSLILAGILVAIAVMTSKSP